MKKTPLNTKGFGLLGALVIVLVVAVAGFSGWLVWHKNHDTKKTANTNNSTSNKDASSTEKKGNILSLVNGDVKFTLPDKWTFVKGEDNCRGNVTADVTCLDGATITPGEKMSTRYGGGTEFFNITVSVFSNPKHSNAQTWIENDFTEGIATGNDVTSDASINGYDTYYWKKIYDGDGTTVNEVSYIFSVNDKAILIYARTYEPGILNDGTKVGDFRQFETSISNMVKTAIIK
jgi:hypothetical protein